MKSLKVGIASYADMKARTMAIARGELKPRPGEPEVWFTSIESFAKVLSDRNRALLGLILEEEPQSLTALAMLALPVPHNFSLDFMKPLRYCSQRGGAESGRAQPAGQPRPTARRGERGGLARR